jgi:hypothetical protein
MTTTLQAMRKVSWGIKYLWEVSIDGVGGSFKEFFPATDVQDTVATVDTHEIMTSISTFEVPKSTSAKGIDITFLDDEQHTLYNFFKKWMTEEILNNEKYVSTVEKSSKLVTIRKLNKKRETIQTDSYYAFPKGELAFAGDNSSEAPSYTVTLIKTETR